MKKTLLSLLTTAAFAAPTFAANDLTVPTETSPTNVGATSAAAPITERSCIQDPTLRLASAVLATRDPGAAELLKEAMAEGAEFYSQNPESGSFIHLSAEISPSTFFKLFLELALDRGFNITDKNEQGFTLLDKAASNPDSEVAEYLIEKGLSTTTTTITTNVANRGIGAVYPLFYAILHDREVLIRTLSLGLSEEQIEQTRSQVSAYKATF